MNNPKFIFFAYFLKFIVLTNFHTEFLFLFPIRSNIKFNPKIRLKYSLNQIKFLIPEI